MQWYAYTFNVSKVVNSLPVGDRVGIAFSGGLDTSVAVAWMREHGAVPYAYTADLGQYDEPDIESVPGARRSTARSWPAWSTAVRRSSRKGSPHSRAARSTSAPAAVPTSTPPRSGGPSPAPCWCGRCSRTASRSGVTAPPSRATTSSGSTGTACSPTPACGSTSRGWTPTSSSELGGRTEMSEWLLERDLPYRASTEKAYSTDANIWGATHEAKSLEHLDASIEIVEPIMGVRFWDPSVEIPAEDVDDRLRAGAAGDDQRQAVRLGRRPRPGGQRDRRPARPRHVGPDREPDHRGQEPGHLRGARHGAAARGVRAAGERHPQRGHHRQLSRRGAPARQAALRGPLAGPAGADAARVAAALGRHGGHRRGDAAAAARRGLLRPRHHRTGVQLPPGQAVAWSGPRPPRSGPPTGSAS